MRPEDIRNRGVGLAERVRNQVDTSQRLELMLRAHRRSRMVALAATAVAVVGVVVGVFLFARISEPPVVIEPTITTISPGARSLPVEVFMVLRHDYTVDQASNTCQGSGPLVGLGQGASVQVLDESGPVREELATVILPAGEEVTASDPKASYLVLGDDQAACVFGLPDLGYDIAAYVNISLVPEVELDVSAGLRISGLRVVYTFENPLFDLQTDLSTDGVASDAPKTTQAEIRALRASAGPG